MDELVSGLCLSERPIPKAHRSPAKAAGTEQVEYRKVDTNFLVQPKIHEQRLKTQRREFLYHENPE